MAEKAFAGPQGAVRRWLPLAIVTWCGIAHAQSDRELATRQEFIVQAGVLSQQGKHAEALELAKRAAAIKMTPSLRMFLAQEQLAIGLLADSYGNGRQCAAEAKADAGLHERQRILAACEELEASLASRVGRITIKVPTPLPPRLHVLLSGEELSAALLDAPYVVTPGKLTVEATADGYLPYKSEIEVAEGASPEVDVNLVADPSSVPCPDRQERVHGRCAERCTDGMVRTSDEEAMCCWPGQSWSASLSACTGAPQCPSGLVAREAACSPPVPPPAPLPPAPQPSNRGTHRLMWSGIVGGGGIAGIGIGTVFGLVAMSTLNTAKHDCPTYTGCSEQAMQERRTFSTQATVSTAAFVTGGALVAGGLTIFLVGPRDAPTVEVHAGLGHLDLSGRF
jgi:hypothetical protein